MGQSKNLPFVIEAHPNFARNKAPAPFPTCSKQNGRNNESVCHHFLPVRKIGSIEAGKQKEV
jgi:hypothetical protein